jgi:galactokinase
MDTNTRRELAGSAYNQRREECAAATRRLGLASLRDLSEPDLDAARDLLDDVTFRRARHVVTENARTAGTAAALRAGDIERAGHSMSASHRSLRDDFEVSSSSFDVIVAAAEAVDGCYGARMTGGGFAGCAVALVDVARCDRFLAAVDRDHTSVTGRRSTLYRSRAIDGASSHIAAY